MRSIKLLWLIAASMCNPETPTQALLKLHSWVYTLLYPAILGSMLVSFAIGIAQYDESFSREGVLFALFLIVYFSSQHVEATLNSSSYSYAKFVADLVEIILMFLLFVLLGFVGPKYSIFATNIYSWNEFYILLTIAFFAPVLARAVDHKHPFYQFREGFLSFLSISAGILSIYGIFSFEHIFIVGFLSFIVAIYFIFFIFGVVIE